MLPEFLNRLFLPLVLVITVLQPLSGVFECVPRNLQFGIAIVQIPRQRIGAQCFICELLLCPRQVIPQNLLGLENR